MIFDYINSGHYYFACNKCSVAFFDQDVIIKLPTGGYTCPNIIKNFLREKFCDTRIYGGDEECFNKYYKDCTDCTDCKDCMGAGCMYCKDRGDNVNISY